MSCSEILKLDEYQRKSRILVIGDIMLARDEASCDLAGAAKIASLINKLGCPVLLAGMVGMDEEGDILKHMLNNEGIPLILGMLSTKPTTVKDSPAARPWQGSGTDSNHGPDNGPGIFHDILRVIALLSDDLKLIALCDFGNGIMTEGLVKAIMEICGLRDIAVIVFANCDDMNRFSGADMVVIRAVSSKLLQGKSPDALQQISDTVSDVISETSSTCVVLCGANGAYLFSGTDIPMYVQCSPGYQVNDSYDREYMFMAALTAGLSRGMSYKEAFTMACSMASIPICGSHP
ncbi:MAG TPA: hypothetical protein PK830_04460 [Candidatus Atribacteria bacterium]|nr:hypothetical protein [Candidatus Atribacteria bacterium]